MAKQLLIHQGGGDATSERQTVLLQADEVDCQAVQTVTVRESVLAVSWPGAKVYPWTSYVFEATPAPPEVTFMRRRLRRILTAFRTHRRGSFVRLAAKINHARMTKDARGIALVNRLVADRILTTFEAGKFYVLDIDLMGQLLGVDYQGLQQQKITPKCDAYLEGIVANM